MNWFGVWNAHFVVQDYSTEDQKCLIIFYALQMWLS